MNNKKAVIYYVAYVILKVLVLFLWMFISLGVKRTTHENILCTMAP